jgi:hypothetical protein
LTFTILGVGFHLVKVIGNIRHAISSKEEARELRRQLDYLFEAIVEVDNKIRRLGGLVPRKLSDIIRALGRYCRKLGEGIRGFQRRFRRNEAFKILNWIGMSVGFNRIEQYQSRLEDCENWFNIALMTLHL